MIRIIGGKFKHKALEVPKKGTRPTLGAMRETLFNVCQQIIEEAEFLDLFSGAGSIGLEALSRGAKHVTFVESNRQAVRLLEKNIASLGVQQQSTLFPFDVFKVLPRLIKEGKQFDIIFADPPYLTGQSQKVLTDIEALLKPDGDLFIEEDRAKRFKTTLHQKSERKVGRSVLRQYKRLLPSEEETCT